MKRRQASALALIAGLFSGGTLGGCSNDTEPPAPRPLMKNGFVVGAPTTGVDATFRKSPHEEMPVTPDASPYFVSTITRKVEAGVAAKVDPDQAIIAGGRAAAVGCFNGIQNGPSMMSATIRVTVVPTGTVTRAEATASTTDASILRCLEGVGEGLRFSDKSDKPTADIRVYAIDVAVNRTH